MEPLKGAEPDSVARRRQLFADFFRLLGASLGTLSPTERSRPQPIADLDKLAPRLAQTLELLLSGCSEKQVAIQMKLSQHTVHGYVKNLYRIYNVSTRSELLAKHLKR